MYDETMMSAAIAMSRKALAETGTKPFGAVVVKDRTIVGRGINNAMVCFDPTAHGEVEAIRDACRKLKTLDLRSCELYSSCEPCSLCVSAIFLCGIRQVYFGTTMKNGGETLAVVKEKLHVDPFELRREAGLAPEDRMLVVSQQHQAAEAAAVLTEWAAFVVSEREQGRLLEIE